jgi:hypothetical protein
MQLLTRLANEGLIYNNNVLARARVEKRIESYR